MVKLVDGRRRKTGEHERQSEIHLKQPTDISGTLSQPELNPCFSSLIIVGEKRNGRLQSFYFPVFITQRID